MGNGQYGVTRKAGIERDRQQKVTSCTQRHAPSLIFVDRLWDQAPPAHRYCEVSGDHAQHLGGKGVDHSDPTAPTIFCIRGKVSIDDLQDMVDDLFIRVLGKHAGEKMSALLPKLDSTGARTCQTKTARILGWERTGTPTSWWKPSRITHNDNTQCLGATMGRLLEDQDETEQSNMNEKVTHSLHEAGKTHGGKGDEHFLKTWVGLELSTLP